MRKILCLLVSLFCGAAFILPAQEGNGGVPKDVFYLMPDMANGSVQFRGQPPATGKFNICAVDNTIRYIDQEGTELAVEIEDDMTRVVIGGVTFVPYDGAFLRLYPLTGDVSAAIRRNVLLHTDSKTSGYGMESQTTAVTSLMGLQGDTKYYQFEDSKDIPYRLSETIFLYKGDSVLTLTKKNFQKCFPNAKEAIDAWFAEHKKMDPADVESIMALCRTWAAI